MKVIDLTHTIRPDMSVYPGTEPPVLETVSTVECDHYRETRLALYSHTGTHIDAPAHVFADGVTLDAMPPDRFVGKALVIDCRDLSVGDEVTMERIRVYGELVKKADFLLFCLGWDRYFGTDAYFGDYPCIDDDVLDFIIGGSYKGIGFDVMGLDPVAYDQIKRHKRLFAECDIIIIENLCSLDKCPRGLFELVCLPLKFENADGAPARVVAITE